MEKTFSKGAKVWPFYNWHLYNKADRLAAKTELNAAFGDYVRGRRVYQFHDVRKCVTGAQLAAVANKARQRRKGPIVRFGGRVRS